MPHDVRSPHIFQDGPGNTASGEEVMDNFDAVWTGVDGLTVLGRIVDGGVSFISADGTRTNVAYGALNNGPDQVAGLVVPAQGIIAVRFSAYWNCSVAAAGRAAIFIGSNQLKNPKAEQAAGVVQEAASAAGTVNNWLYSSSLGLSGTDGTSTGVEGTAAVTTGITRSGLNASGALNGGHCEIIGLSAGTYTVSVQFKSASGTVTAGNRRLSCEVYAYS
jgi:hypothetical protein